MDALKALLTERNEEALISKIAKNPDILDQKDDSGTSLFLYLVYYGLTETFTFAKSKKTDFQFSWGHYHWWSRFGKIQIIRKYRFNWNILARRFHAHCTSAFFDQTEIAEFLLSKGANPETRAQNPNLVNALHSAAKRGNIALVKLLLTYGADTSLKMDSGETALSIALAENKPELVEILKANKWVPSIKI